MFMADRLWRFGREKDESLSVTRMPQDAKSSFSSYLQRGLHACFFHFSESDEFIIFSFRDKLLVFRPLERMTPSFLDSWRPKKRPSKLSAYINISNIKVPKSPFFITHFLKITSWKLSSFHLLSLPPPRRLKSNPSSTRGLTLSMSMPVKLASVKLDTSATAIKVKANANTVFYNPSLPSPPSLKRLAFVINVLIS